MKKEMFKKSFVLGAIMAILITGNAMAMQQITGNQDSYEIEQGEANEVQLVINNDGYQSKNWTVTAGDNQDVTFTEFQFFGTNSKNSLSISGYNINFTNVRSYTGTVDINADGILNFTGSDTYHAIRVGNTASTSTGVLNVTANIINITNEKGTAVSTGPDSKLQLKADTLNITAGNSHSVKAIDGNVDVFSDNVVINVDNSQVTNTGNSHSVFGSVNFSGKDSETGNITKAESITITTKNVANAVMSSGNNITFNTKRLIIDSDTNALQAIENEGNLAIFADEVDLKGDVYALKGGSVNIGTEENAVKNIKIDGNIRTIKYNDADNTVKTETQINIHSNEKLVIDGNIDTTDREGGIININQGGHDGGVVQITGDILTGDIKDDEWNNAGHVNITLSGENSFLNGKIVDNNIVNGVDGGGTSITLDNGAIWNMSDNATVTNLVLSNGADLNVNYDKVNSTDYRSLTAVNFTGEGGIVKLDIDASTNENNSDRIFINGTHKDTHYITLNNVGANTDSAAGTVLVSVNNEQGEFKANDSEGALYWNRYNLDRLDKANGDNVTDGYNTDWYLKEVEQLDESTTSVDTILGANALNYHTWRAENDQLMRRMGELRNNGADEEGAWFRVHGSKISRDDNAAFENEYTTYELGYDQITKQTEDMTRYTGAALSYTDGSGTYERGNGENHSKAIAFYNTDIYNSGHYLDLVFKYANMDNDFNVYDTNNNKISGEYKNTGISVSAEYGRKNDLKNGWYVEPQAQLTLGYFGGDEYETSNGIKVEQGGIASVLGRVGFNIGKQIGDSGVIYAKANLLHEFAGDYDIDMTDSTGISRSESESFNDTWFEYGVGAALKTGKNNHLYFDFVKTAGGDFEKDWQWNAGMRWTF